MNFKFRHFRSNLTLEKRPLDMTPLIDVVFQLMIFFLLSSSFVLQPGIKVDLPATRLRSGEKSTKFSVSIQRNGQIFFNEEKVRVADLEERLRREKVAEPNELLIIKADEKARHGVVVEVMAAAKRVGIARMAIATKPDFSEERGDEVEE